MVIYLTNADFSAEGKHVDTITPRRSINAFTLSAITASGNEDMTSEQKIALDVFFSQLGAFGDSANIWSKLERVYMPFICGSLDKSLTNFVDNDVDCTPDSTYFALDGGLYATAKGGILNVGTDTWNWSNRSVCELADYPATNYGGLMVMCKTSETDVKKVVGSLTSSHFLVQAYTNYNTFTNLSANTDTSGISTRCLSGSSSGYTLIDGNGKTITASLDTSLCNDNSGSLMLHAGSQYQGQVGTNYGKMYAEIIGQSLTEAEMLTLKSALDTLYSKFV